MLYVYMAFTVPSLRIFRRVIHASEALILPVAGAAARGGVADQHQAGVLLLWWSYSKLKEKDLSKSRQAEANSTCSPDYM